MTIMITSITSSFTIMVTESAVSIYDNGNSEIPLAKANNISYSNNSNSTIPWLLDMTIMVTANTNSLKIMVAANTINHYDDDISQLQ